MTDKPILFSGPMVRALLEGRKTQTRRKLSEAHPKFPHNKNLRHGVLDFDQANPQVWYWDGVHDRVGASLNLRHAKNDRLWVREAWRTQEAFDDLSPKQIMTEFEEEWGAPSIPTFYEADHKCDDHSIELWQQSQPGRLRASMHMPRCASRITLIVTDVRVQRLHEISEADAKEEGITEHPCLGPHRGPAATFWTAGDGSRAEGAALSPKLAFAALWNSINGAGAWEQNPWVAAYSFRCVKKNIDEVQGDD